MCVEELVGRFLRGGRVDAAGLVDHSRGGCDGHGHRRPHGLWETNGGVEGNVCIAAVALVVAAIGPGRLTADRFLRWGTGGWVEAACALGLGGAAAVITLSL
ncbi:hypothetical protein [Streptomyces sp. NPDC056821]|uniref:hypothetical protein n=1 Tax=unclassified Streptomyces TaxID=2593676 RepID=UPI00367FE9F7